MAQLAKAARRARAKEKRGRFIYALAMRWARAKQKVTEDEASFVYSLWTAADTERLRLRREDEEILFSRLRTELHLDVLDEQAAREKHSSK